MVPDISRTTNSRNLQLQRKARQGPPSTKSRLLDGESVGAEAVSEIENLLRYSLVGGGKIM